MPVPNALVNISITDPTGAVTPSTLTTDANGNGVISVLLAIVGVYTGETDYAGDPTQNLAPATGKFVIAATPAPTPVYITLTPSAPSAAVGSTVTVAFNMDTAAPAAHKA